jgi:hypothetical protein
MKDGFELAPTKSGLFLFKKFLSASGWNLSLPPLKQRGFKPQSLSVEGPFV